MTTWSDKMDRELLRRRRDEKQPWRNVFPINGMGKTRCQRRYKFLMSGVGKPEVKVGPAPEPVIRDGLVWLEKKKRLSSDQLREALIYRANFRDGGDLSMKSSLASLGMIAATGARDLHLDGGMVSLTTAKRELLVSRYQVLRGQVDMLSVMDGVCGLGWTPRDLAKGDQLRALELVAVLKVALDLLIAHRVLTKAIDAAKALDADRA